MAITLTQLRSFLAVYRTGSVTGAADELVVTQPSVSAAVSALSRELEVELTERVGRSIRPTPAGDAFAPYATDVIGLLEEGRRAAGEAGQSAGRELRIAAVTTAGEHIVPALMEAFVALHPVVSLSVHVGNRQDVFDPPSDPPVRPCDRRPAAGQGRGGRALSRQSDRDHHGARRPAGRAALGAHRRAGAPSVAHARGGVRHPHDDRGLPRRPRRAPSPVHARLQRRDQAGRAGPPRCRDSVAARCAARAGPGPARDDRARRVAAQARLVRAPFRAWPDQADGTRVPLVRAWRGPARRGGRQARGSAESPSRRASRPAPAARTRWARQQPRHRWRGCPRSPSRSRPSRSRGGRG